MKLNRPLSVKITTGFILIGACTWLILGILIAFNIHTALPDNPIVRTMMAITSFVLASILIGLAYLIQKPNPFIYYLTLAIFVGSALLTFFDDIGLADLFVLILNLIPVFLLLKDRKWYLQRPSQFQPGT
ncbi:MAG TPA: hypothetical protein VLD65_03475 [Anaerolineales bacterium]|nr:hypothetical protein [Anaerolineales bacterium]